MRLRSLPVVAGLLLALLPATLRADDDPDRENYDLGVVAYGKHDCALAADAFDRVHGPLSRDPSFITYAAKANECAGRLKRALDFYRLSEPFSQDPMACHRKIGELNYALEAEKRKGNPGSAGANQFSRGSGPGSAAIETQVASLVPPPNLAPAGTARTDAKTGLAWVSLPAGTFSMGCASYDPQCRDDERPALHKSVPALWMNPTLVTVADWRKCMQAGACRKPFGFEFSKACFGLIQYPVSVPCNFDQGLAESPINCVNQPQARAFCTWAGGRLPTAAEWEYAAKSGRDVVYPWGNDPPDPARARFESTGTDTVGFHPAGDTLWGLKDMAGNLWEWTESRTQSGDFEVRGGSWRERAGELRASNRASRRPNNPSSPYENGYQDVGLRCVQ